MARIGFTAMFNTDSVPDEAWAISAFSGYISGRCTGLLDVGGGLFGIGCELVVASPEGWDQRLVLFRFSRAAVEREIAEFPSEIALLYNYLWVCFDWATRERAIQRDHPAFELYEVAFGSGSMVGKQSLTDGKLRVWCRNLKDVFQLTAGLTLKYASVQNNWQPAFADNVIDGEPYFYGFPAREVVEGRIPPTPPWPIQSWL
jgi:hypothetical protein